MGFLGDPFVCNGFLAAYCKSLKDLVSTRKLFDEMPDKVVVCCWTALTSGYAQSGQTEDVLQFFLMMVQLNLQLKMIPWSVYYLGHELWLSDLKDTAKKKKKKKNMEKGC